jgi:hypothetical protein
MNFKIESREVTFRLALHGANITVSPSTAELTEMALAIAIKRL